jgi:hypothetical protein
MHFFKRAAHAQVRTCLRFASLSIDSARRRCVSPSAAHRTLRRFWYCTAPRTQSARPQTQQTWLTTFKAHSLWRSRAQITGSRPGNSSCWRQCRPLLYRQAARRACAEGTTNSFGSLIHDHCNNVCFSYQDGTLDMYSCQPQLTAGLPFL